jgi:hypothetical protein
MFEVVVGALIGAVFALGGGICAEYWRARRLARVAAELIAQELEAHRGVIRWVQTSGHEDRLVIAVWEAERNNFLMGTRRTNRLPVTDWYRSIYYSDHVDKTSAEARAKSCERALEAAKRQAALGM